MHQELVSTRSMLDMNNQSIRLKSWMSTHRNDRLLELERGGSMDS